MALVVVTMSPVFVLFLTASSRERARAAEAAQESLLAEASGTAQRFDALAIEARRFVATLAAIPAVRTGDEEACELLRDAAGVDTRYLTLALVDASGGWICQTLPASTEGVSVEDREWVRTPLDSALAATQIIRTGRVSGRTVLVVSHPVLGTRGEPARVLAAGLDLGTLLEAQTEEQTTAVALVDAVGVLVGDASATAALDETDLVAFFGSGEPTSTFTASDMSSLGGLARVQSVASLAAVALTSDQVLFGPIRADFNRNLGLLLLLTALSLGIAYWGSDRIVMRPLTEIGQAADRLGAGDLNARIAAKSGPRELRALADTFDRMAKALEARDEAVRAAQEQLAETHRQLAQAQKMEAVGQLTGGVAHDFNNLLTVIEGCLGLIDSTQLSEDDRELLMEAAVASNRGVELTSRLLAFSRRQQLSPRRIDLNALATEIEPLLTRTLGEDTRVFFDLEEPGPKCVADPGELERALVNLALNARDAMPDGGVLTIRTGWADASEVDAVDLPPGRYARLSVCDEGVGMSPEMRSRAVEPFFTTKSRGRGTGLGLSGAFGFARQSGGGLIIESEEGEGTTVHVMLPTSAPPREEGDAVDS